MDGKAPSVSSAELFARLGTASMPVLLDVRRHDAFEADSRQIVGAVRAPSENVTRWVQDRTAGRPIVAYCVHGHSVSQDAVAELRRNGLNAAFLDGGIDGWKAAGFPTRKKLGLIENKWITREHPKIDRIACPWLISRFINPLAEFLYVPANDVATVAKQQDATPYDIKGAEFGHVGDHCSFDAIIRIFEIKDPALDHLARIVRGADTSRPDLTPQCEGLLAISYGLSTNYPDDHEMLAHGIVIYDALYSWCRSQRPQEGTK